MDVKDSQLSKADPPIVVKVLDRATEVNDLQSTKV